MLVKRWFYEINTKFHLETDKDLLMNFVTSLIENAIEKEFKAFSPIIDSVSIDKKPTLLSTS